MRKWTIRQFEWYRDNKILITVSSNRQLVADFFIYKENLLYGTPCNAGKSADGRWVSQQLTHPGKRGIREFFLTDSNKGLANIPETMAVKKP